MGQKMQHYNKPNLEKTICQQVTLKDAHSDSIPLTLQSICTNKADNHEWESFTAYYSNNNNVRIPAGCYTFLHAAFGESTLFITPKSPTEYETVVTRKKTPRSTPATK